LNFGTEEDVMSKTAVPRSAVMIAFLAAATAVQAQTHESDIPNLASAAFGWQHGFDGLNFQRVEGKVAPTGRGPMLPGIERLGTAWDDAATIAVMTTQTGPGRADRVRMRSLPPGLTDAINRGFGGNVEPQDRSAVWDDLRRRLRENADSELAH
jgi:hypothetical protein